MLRRHPETALHYICIRVRAPQFSVNLDKTVLIMYIMIYSIRKCPSQEMIKGKRNKHLCTDKALKRKNYDTRRKIRDL